VGFALGKKERPGAMPSGQTKEKEQMACVGKAGRRQLRPRKEEVGQVRCVSRPRRERVREWIGATLWASTQDEEEAGRSFGLAPCFPTPFGFYNFYKPN